MTIRILTCAQYFCGIMSLQCDEAEKASPMGFLALPCVVNLTML